MGTRKLTKREVSELTALIPMDAKGEKVSFTEEDLVNLSRVAKIARRRTNMVALDVVLGISLKDALAAAYLQGMNDTVIGYVKNEADN